MGLRVLIEFTFSLIVFLLFSLDTVGQASYEQIWIIQGGRLDLLSTWLLPPTSLHAFTETPLALVAIVNETKIGSGEIHHTCARLAAN
jgi:hypothetical protein